MTHDLIVFAEDWGGLPSSTQHLIKQLAKTRKVVWINSIGLRQPTLSVNDIKRLWAKLTATKTTSVNIESNEIENNIESNINESTSVDFHIINPRTLPAPRSALARYVAQKLLLLQIHYLLRLIFLAI